MGEKEQNKGNKGRDQKVRERKGKESYQHHKEKEEFRPGIQSMEEGLPFYVEKNHF